MRLVLVNPNTSEVTTGAMLAIARDAAAADVTIDGVTAPFGAALITDAAALAVAADAVAALGETLARHAPAGVIVAAFGDPGLARLRGTLRCPVTGIAEASMAEAASDGRAFAVATTTPGLAGAIGEMARAYGYRDLFRGVRVARGEPHAVMSDSSRLEEALAIACDEAIREDGAQAVIIGGGPLATAARALKPRFAVPIIEPIPAAVRLAIARARAADQLRPLMR
jgi:allantoin racemase